MAYRVIATALLLLLAKSALVADSKGKPKLLLLLHYIIV